MKYVKKNHQGEKIGHAVNNQFEVSGNLTKGFRYFSYVITPCCDCRGWLEVACPELDLQLWCEDIDDVEQKIMWAAARFMDDKTAPEIIAVLAKNGYAATDNQGASPWWTVTRQANCSAQDMINQAIFMAVNPQLNARLITAEPAPEAGCVLTLKGAGDLESCMIKFYAQGRFAWQINLRPRPRAAAPPEKIDLLAGDGAYMSEHKNFLEKLREFEGSLG